MQENTTTRLAPSPPAWGHQHQSPPPGTPHRHGATQLFPIAPKFARTVPHVSEFSFPSSLWSRDEMGSRYRVESSLELLGQAIFWLYFPKQASPTVRGPIICLRLPSFCRQRKSPVFSQPPANGLLGGLWACATVNNTSINTNGPRVPHFQSSGCTW